MEIIDTFARPVIDLKTHRAKQGNKKTRAVPLTPEWLDAARDRPLCIAHFESALQYAAERIAENRMSLSRVDSSFKKVTGMGILEFAASAQERSKCDL